MASPKVTAVAAPLQQPPVVFQNASPHSVEISRTAKGDTTFAVKVYGDRSDEAMRQALETYAALEARFPLASAQGVRG